MPLDGFLLLLIIMLVAIVLGQGGSGANLPGTENLSEPVLKMERGCVKDQPQHTRRAKSVNGLLRLAEDDTAAVRIFKTRSQLLVEVCRH